MKIALFVPNTTYADWYNYPLLGLCYLKAVLEKSGHKCRIFDPRFHRWQKQELITRIVDYKPDVVGLSAMTHEINAGAEIASKIKKSLPNVPLTVGGCHVTALPKQTIEEFPIFDYAVYGEGEKTFSELLQHIENKNSPHLDKISGIAFQTNGQSIITPAREYLSADELNALPYPALDDYYPRNSMALKDKNAEYVMYATRGCPFNCAFCMQILGRKVRQRSAKSICDEILYAEKVYGAHTIRFRDEIFLFNNKHTLETLELMIKLGFPKRLRWSGQLRVDCVEPSLIALAKKAGCYRLGMGVESGDDNILKNVGRGYTVEKARKAVDIIKKEGIHLGTYYILGHPNETRQTVKKTVDLVAELNTNTAAVGLMVPYPGTRIYEMALNGEGGYRLLSQNWEDFDKYNSSCLELENLSHDELVKWQKSAILNLYLKNFRFLDLTKYIWEKRRAIAMMLLSK